MFFGIPYKTMALEDEIFGTVITIMRFHGLWNMELNTNRFKLLKVVAFYGSSYGIVAGCLLHLFFGEHDNDIMDISNDILYTIMGAFYLYVFLVFLSKIEAFFQYVDEIKTNWEFGVPKAIHGLNKKHDLYAKSIYCMTFFSVIGLAVFVHFGKPYCERKNELYGTHNTCGLLGPFFIPGFNTDDYQLLILGCQLYSVLLTTPTITTCSYFGAAMVDVITLKLAHLNEHIEDVSDCSTYHEQRNKLTFCVKYHNHIMGLHRQLLDCTETISSVHFMLSALIIGIIIYQLYIDINVFTICQVCGWFGIIILLSLSGQALVNEVYLVLKLFLCF
ncbi:uncharacterized protein LOC126266008 [Aethina tumida]|uniref:uncharacterized protein LOC126266008 n=1 Tax=Aethina tumida TaxID=116153 RepID=UPI0021492AED|nr:uncharacterized protein LOC126266008 [Aethina tumida]